MRKPALLFVCAVGCLALLFSMTPQAQERAPAAAAPWNEETLHLFGTLPVQEGGRLKPMDTFARFRLLRFNGKRSCRDEADRRMSASAWLLECLVRPEEAQHIRMFRVEDSSLIEAIGATPRKKRDRYAYRDIAPARDRLMELRGQCLSVSQDQRSALQKALLKLAQDIEDFETLVVFSHFARVSFSLEGRPALAALFPGRETVGLLEVLERLPEIRAIDADHSRSPAKRQEAGALLQDLQMVARLAEGLALIPPPRTGGGDAWRSPGRLLAGAIAAGRLPEADREWLEALVGLVEARERPAVFQERLAAVHEAAWRALSPGQRRTLSWETAYYRAQPFFWGLVLYLVGLLILALSWLEPGRLFLPEGQPLVGMRRVGRRLPGFCAMLALVFVGGGLIARCIIRGRPPATTMYETILFVTFAGSVAALVAEAVQRRRIGLALSLILGIAGLLLAGKYEAREGVDTMPSMVAVLDTNFWLTLHVTTIALGYAGGLLAAALGHAFVLARAVGKAQPGGALRRDLTEMTHGMIGFALFFSVLGTVLGGIWASQSWGRFWGWDPKENGALMVVLWLLLIVHARAGGYIRETGIHLGGIAAGGFIIFSWFGVNLLGTGLHSYGFMAGTFVGLTLLYTVEMLVLLVGGAIWFQERKVRRM